MSSNPSSVPGSHQTLDLDRMLPPCDWESNKGFQARHELYCGRSLDNWMTSNKSFNCFEAECSHL